MGFLFSVLIYLGIELYLSFFRRKSFCSREGKYGLFGFLVRIASFFIAPTTAFFYLKRNDFGNSNELFHDDHIDAVIIVSAIAILGYTLSTFYKTKLKLWVRHLCLMAMLQGLIICVFMQIHFGMTNLLGIFFPMLGYELVAPVICILFIIIELRRIYVQSEFADGQYLLFNNKSTYWLSIVVAFIVGQALILLLFGYTYQDISLAFTESINFFFSKTNDYG